MPIEIRNNRKEVVPGESELEAIQILEAPRTYSDPCPIFNRILVRQHAKQTTWGGTTLYIPESAQQSPNKGVCVCTSQFFIVGGEKFPMSDEVNPGDIVTFGQYNAEEVVLDGETFVLVPIFDVKLVERVAYAVAAS